MDAQVFEPAHPLYFKLPYVQWLMRSPLLPHVHYHLLCLGLGLGLGVVFVGGNTVVGEQGVEDGAEDASLWSANVCDDAG